MKVYWATIDINRGLTESYVHLGGDHPVVHVIAHLAAEWINGDPRVVAQVHSQTVDVPEEEGPDNQGPWPRADHWAEAESSAIQRDLWNIDDDVPY